MTLMPKEVFVAGAESVLGVEVARLAVVCREALTMRRGFRKSADGDFDQEVIAFREGGPKAGVEHPAGVGGEGVAVAGVVVAGNGVLVDVGCFDEGT